MAENAGQSRRRGRPPPAAGSPTTAATVLIEAATIAGERSREHERAAVPFTQRAGRRRSGANGELDAVLASTVRRRTGLPASGGTVVNERRRRRRRDRPWDSEESTIARQHGGTANSAVGEPSVARRWRRAAPSVSPCGSANSTLRRETPPADGANLGDPASASVRQHDHRRARSAARDCCGSPLTSLGYNLAEYPGCGGRFNQPTDQVGVDPLLGPLAGNSGATETMALLPGSPAIDRGLASAGESLDQRGLRRPVEIFGAANAVGGDGTDIGALEVQAPRASIVRGPGEGETIADPEPSFEFVADEATATFSCALDGAAGVPCASPFRVPRLADGPHTLSIEAVDAAGFGQPPAARTFSVDTRVSKSPDPTPRSDDKTKGDDKVVPLPPASAPRATIAALPAKTGRRRLTIRFDSDQPGTTFGLPLRQAPLARLQLALPDAEARASDSTASN